MISKLIEEKRPKVFCDLSDAARSLAQTRGALLVDLDRLERDLRASGG